MSAADGMPLAEVLDGWDGVVAEWGLSPEERSLLIGGFRKGPIDQVESYELLCGEMRMRLLVQLAPLLRKVHGDHRRTQAWLRRENGSLGGRSPIAVMASSPEWIHWLLRNVELGS